MDSLPSPDERRPTHSFQWYPQLLGICCLSHFSVHMSEFQADSMAWWLAAAIVVTSCLILYQPNLQRLLMLCGLQVAHTLLDAPYNPDHWLLLFFVNLTTLGAAVRCWRKQGGVTHSELFERFVPAARLVFLVCYGSAAAAKFNSHFLTTDGNCAVELLNYQIKAMPLLSYFVWKPSVAWLTVLFETALPVCLCIRPLRNFGIMIGLFFHGMIVASPAVMVFDFTIVVYTLAYLFSPPSFDERLGERLARFHRAGPTLFSRLRRLSAYGLAAACTAILATSLGGTSLMDVTNGFVLRRWFVTTAIAVSMFTLTGLTLYSPKLPTATVRLLPRSALQFAIIGLAVVNAMCPYVGLKTQGSFTMFSNLRTSEEAWNHYLIPQAVHVVDKYQNDLVHVLETSNPQLKSTYIDRECSAPLFEVRRMAMSDPHMSLTVWRNGKVVVIPDASSDPDFGQRLSWLERKTLIFRPEKRDCSPYCGN